MNRTFKGTVVAINPTDTSNFRGGCVAVSVRVDPTEMGQLSFTLTMNVPVDDARAMGALVGLPNAVSVSVSAVETRGDQLPDVGHYFTAGARLCRREEEGSAVVADVYDSRVGKLTESEHATRLEREGALINGEKLAISLLREVVAFASDTKMHNDHTGAVNWLLEFIERPDVRNIATDVKAPTDRVTIAKTMIGALTDEEWDRARPKMCSGCFCRLADDQRCYCQRDD